MGYDFPVVCPTPTTRAGRREPPLAASGSVGLWALWSILTWEAENPGLSSPEERPGARGGVKGCGCLLRVDYPEVLDHPNALPEGAWSGAATLGPD